MSLCVYCGERPRDASGAFVSAEVCLMCADLPGLDRAWWRRRRERMRGPVDVAARMRRWWAGRRTPEEIQGLAAMFEESA